MRTATRKPRRILITGATAGIGRAAATLLAARGHEVIPAGRRTAALESLVADVRAAHGDAAAGRLHPLTLDINVTSEIEGAPAMARALLGGADVEVLVNNAGYSQVGPVELLTDEQITAQLRTNVVAPQLLLRAFAPAMRGAGWGRIIHVSSTMAHVTLPLHGAYNASKAAMDAFGTAARMELRPQGIDVVLVEPGPIQTEFEAASVGGVDVAAATGTPYEQSMGDLAAVYTNFYRHGKPPTFTAEQIRRAVEDTRPKARYRAALESAQLVADRIAPIRIADRVKARGVHL